MSTDGSPRLELWLRRDTYGTYEAQQAALDRARALEARGVVEDVSVASCDGHVGLAVDPRSAAREAFEDFEAWASATGNGLEPAFERRERSPLLSDVRHEVVVFPVVGLAVYDDDDLRGVFPCTDGDVVHTVRDCLDAFETGEADALLSALSESDTEGASVARTTVP